MLLLLWYDHHQGSQWSRHELQLLTKIVYIPQSILVCCYIVVAMATEHRFITIGASLREYHSTCVVIHGELHHEILQLSYGVQGHKWQIVMSFGS